MANRSAWRLAFPLLLVAALTACGRQGKAADDRPAGLEQVRPELIAQHASIQPGGTTRVGVHFDIAPGWHIYYNVPGDAGLATSIAWSSSREAQFGPLFWPPPEHFLDPGDIHTQGYTGAVTLSSELKVKSSAALGSSVPVHAKVAWLACKEQCIPGHAALDLALPIGAKPPVSSTHAELFDQVH